MSLSNVVEAYDKSSDPGLRSEFSWTPEEAARTAKWGGLASDLVTNMHEVIGHASGKLEEKLNGKPELAIKEFYSRSGRRPRRSRRPATSSPTRNSPNSA